jgi:hypothetical protein
VALSGTQLASLHGPSGQVGPTGPQGVSMPAGGRADQILRKHSAADHDSEWAPTPTNDPLFIKAARPAQNNWLAPIATT